MTRRVWHPCRLFFLTAQRAGFFIAHSIIAIGVLHRNSITINPYNDRRSHLGGRLFSLLRAVVSVGKDKRPCSVYLDSF